MKKAPKAKIPKSAVKTSRKSAVMLVMTTFEKKSDARRIAKILVQEKLAACANLVPAVESFYRWKGKFRAGREWLLLIKTSTPYFSRLQQKLETIHPYECPEIAGFEMIKLNAPYRQWLFEQLD